MELEALRFLLVAAEEESFTRAATKLGIRQSAVSRQILRLERELDTLLLYRNGRGVRLTDAGEKLRRVGLEIFKSLDDVREELLADNTRFRGTVTLGLPPSLGGTISASLVRRFQKHFPDAQLRVVVAFSGTLLEWLVAGRIDVGVLYDARRSRTLLVTPLLLENLHLIEAPGRRKAPDHAELAELGAGPFVLSCSPNGMRTIVDGAASRLNIKMQITAEIDSLDALKEIVESGPERSILPLGAVHREVKAGRLRSRLFTDPQMQALLVLATPLNKSVSKLAAAVLRLVEEEISRCVHDGILSGVAGSKLRQTIVGKMQTAPVI